MVFQSIFSSNDNSVLLLTPNPLFLFQNYLLKTKESVIQLNSTNNDINKLLVHFISIRAYFEKFKYPFLIYIVNEAFKPKNTPFNNVIINKDTLFNEFKQYKSIKKLKTCIFTPKEMLDLYKKCQNNKIDMFSMARFCFANINYNDDFSYLLYGLSANKINEMDDNNNGFPLQLVMMTDHPSDESLALFNKVDLISDFHDQKNNDFKAILKQINNLDINSTVDKTLFDIIKKMANKNEKLGEILICTSDANSNKEIFNRIIKNVSSCTAKNCKVIPIDYRKHKLLDPKKIHAFGQRISQFYNLKQNAIFVLPINTDVDFQFNFKFFSIVRDPIKSHSNVIKIIITNKPSELPPIMRLSSIIDIAVSFDEYYDENDIKCTYIKTFSSNELSQRKSLYKSMNPKQHYQIVSDDNSFNDEYRNNIYDTVFKYLNLGFTIEELQIYELFHK